MVLSLADLLGLWPIGTVVAATVLRLVADEVREARPQTRVDRLLDELLSVASLVLIIAGGVGFALLFGRRLGL